MPSKVIIGTRGSKLALIQAQRVKRILLEKNESLEIEIKTIQTQGDADKISALSEIGGKGVFIKSIEQELVDKKIDLAVHSLKDVTAALHPNTELAAFLKPESQRDCLILSNGAKIDKLSDLKDGSVIATSSLRRKLLLQRLNKTWQVKDIRGNVDTRLKKCKDGFADALLLSEAGLLRLGHDKLISLSLSPKDFLPAPGQGVISVQCRKDDEFSKSLLSTITDKTQHILSSSELAIVNTVGLDCNYPLALFAWIDNDELCIDAIWGTRSLSKEYSDSKRAPLNQKDALITHFSEQIKRCIHDD